MDLHEAARRGDVERVRELLDAAALTPFLSLAAPARHLVTTAPRFGIGVIARDGASSRSTSFSRSRRASMRRRSCSRTASGSGRG